MNLKIFSVSGCSSSCVPASGMPAGVIYERQGQDWDVWSEGYRRCSSAMASDWFLRCNLFCWEHFYFCQRGRYQVPVLTTRHWQFEGSSIRPLTSSQIFCCLIQFWRVSFFFFSSAEKHGWRVRWVLTIAVVTSYEISLSRKILFVRIFYRGHLGCI